MTVKEIAQVMGTQFIAVRKGNKIPYSGIANKINCWCENEEVKEIINPKDKHAATIIVIA